MSDVLDRMGLELIETTKLAAKRMEQFNELVEALRRCHTALVVQKFLSGGDNDTLSDIIEQAEKILLKVETTDDANHHEV